MKSLLLLVSLIAYINGHNIHIALKQSRLPELYNNVYDVSDPYSPDYLEFWTSRQIQDLVSPPIKVRREVTKWLVMDLEIPYNVIEDRGDSLTFPYSPSRAKSIKLSSRPRHIDEYIDMIIGLEIPQTQKLKNNVCPESFKPDPGYVGREVLERLYGVVDYKGNVSIGVVQYDSGEGFTESDLHDYQRNNGLPVKNVSHVIGDVVGGGGEGELDIQMISNLGNANLWFIVVDGWIYDFASDLLTWKTFPWITSHSYGWSEYNQCMIVQCTNFTSADYIRRTNTELAKLALKGHSMLVASGDAGSPGRTDEGCHGVPRLNPVFPGSSPWIMSVGATYIVNGTGNSSHYKTPLCKSNNCANGTLQEEVTFNKTGWTSGSGFGVYSEPVNIWQRPFVEEYLNSGIQLPPNSSFNRNGRAYPDLSVVGHQCATFMGGGLQGADGTSCSSPVMASLLGYISAKVGKPLGLFTPTLYSLYKRDPTLFQDITKGGSQCTEAECCNNNWGFLPAKGWDPVSGLGTPKVGKIAEKLRKHIRT